MPVALGARRGHILVVLLLGASCGRGPKAASHGLSAPGAQAERDRILLLSGTLEASQGADLVAPRVPGNRVSLRWLIEDGTRVKAGDRVAEFDNSAFAQDIKERRLSFAQARLDLATQRYDAQVRLAEKREDIEKKRGELEKARLSASVGETVLPKREYLQKQLALQRAASDLEKAQDDLALTERTAALDSRVKELELAKSEREIKRAEDAISVLLLTAPRDGIVIVAEHPWQGRKLRVGDELWRGFKVASIPDLGALRVEAGLPDADLSRVSVGMTTSAVADAFPDERLTGTITAVSPTSRQNDENSLRRLFSVTASLTSPLALKDRLRPGMAVRLEVQARPFAGETSP